MICMSALCITAGTVIRAATEKHRAKSLTDPQPAIIGDRVGAISKLHRWVHI